MKNFLHNLFRRANRKYWVAVLLVVVTAAAAVWLTFVRFRQRDARLLANADRDPVLAVSNSLEASKNNDDAAWKATMWDPQDYAEDDSKVVSLSVLEVRVSDSATQEWKKNYIGSELAKSRGWSDDFLRKNMIAVYAHYNIQVDHTPVPEENGDNKVYFYLVRNDENSPWTIFDTNGQAEAIEK